MLTKEILCAYLPYNVEIASPKMKNGIRSIMTLKARHLNDDGTLGESLYKPILRPLSSLTKNEMNILRAMKFRECNQWTNTHYNWIKEVKSFPTLQRYDITQKLLSWHFDIFGLLESGHAIELKEEK